MLFFDGVQYFFKKSKNPKWSNILGRLALQGLRTLILPSAQQTQPNVKLPPLPIKRSATAAQRTQSNVKLLPLLIARSTTRDSQEPATWVFRRGIAAFQAKNYQRAVRYFDQAFEASSNESITLKINILDSRAAAKEKLDDIKGSLSDAKLTIVCTSS
ncbi:hypothetical protein PtA15_8A203 [Puccinia triticina]|uniref:Uncharacterized protein n=1 Tax=Puccinia triticina TaxID=208348 RepID=A0ABY7CPW5_9BASI|nr:uncharacterized protein PtA15_8A203 [Puccinia triticina]WAQ87299.1 hypothetical protein PtA15_8A203 [Puccinia triticina]WAR57152.1 hypothetical protein PtB15_8B198 [Puccinia triticina]